MAGYAGADWVEKSYGKKCSPLGRKVADILGNVYLGIYHMHDMDPIGFERIDWEDDHHIVVQIAENGGLATADMPRLTNLVIACHDAAVRCEISPFSQKRLELMFHQRKRTGGMGERHPTIEEQIQIYRKHIASSTE